MLLIFLLEIQGGVRLNLDFSVAMIAFYFKNWILDTVALVAEARACGQSAEGAREAMRTD